jgi:hypothetical protein
LNILSKFGIGLLFSFFSLYALQIPATYVHFMTRFPIRPSNLIFVTVTAVNVPRVRDDLVVTPVLNYPNVFRAVVNHGYMEDTPPAILLAACIIRKLPQLVPSGVDIQNTADAELVMTVDPTFVMVIQHKQISEILSTLKRVIC